MSNDINLIVQLEREIGIELKAHKFSEISNYENTGFSINKRNKVNGLNLNRVILPLFPVTISKFRSLIKISLCATRINDISFLKDFNKLTTLHLSSNQISDISCLERLINLADLDLKDNRVTDASILKRLRNLASLDLSMNPLKDFSFIRKLTGLIDLSLNDNGISDISFLRDSNILNKLYLAENKIANISVLQGLINLVVLDLSRNQISEISCLQELHELNILNLSTNHIKDISSLIGLRKLKKLDLRDNKIVELPEAILDLDMHIGSDTEYMGGGRLFLQSNPLETPPVEIVMKGPKAIYAYYSSLKEGEQLPLNEVKVLIVGDGGAGKTSLVKRLMGQEFNKDEPQTHGINIDPWIINDGEIKVNLWDFGGQEIMHATHQFFLSERSLYILLLDGRRDEKTEYWLKLIESFGGDSPVLVVINKVDQNPSFDVNRKFLFEKYKNILGFYRISCAKNEGIDLFAQALKEAIFKVKILTTTWSISWFNVKTKMENMTDYFISYKSYTEICEKEGITEKSSQDTLVAFLNDLGVILHFKDLALDDTHVLEPEWVTEAVYKIINSDILTKTKGVLELSLMDKILKKKSKKNYSYPVDKYKYIIELMKKFELCYEIDRERVLIPDLLEVEECHFDFDYVSSLKFIFEYDFLPKSVMPRFIVRMHKDIKNGLQWRTGVVLKDDIFHSTAVIKADERDRKIYIYVSGEQKRYYFAVIRHTFRDINLSFEKLEVSERVPVPDNLKVTVSYNHLIQLKSMNQREYVPEGAKKAYNIDELLFEFEENRSSSLALNINKRWEILDVLDALLFDPMTYELEIHNILEKNLWVLGQEYSKISSNETLKRVVEEYLRKKYKGDSAKKRPDLLLAQNMNRSFLLIELKRPGHVLDRDDEAQALKYRDDLKVHLPQAKIDLMLIGGQVKRTISPNELRFGVKFISYKEIVSNARNNLRWLINDLDKRHEGYEINIENEINSSEMKNVDPFASEKIKPKMIQQAKVRSKIDIEEQLDMNIKKNLPTIQSDFSMLKEIFTDIAPKLEKEMEKIEDSLDEVSAESDKDKFKKPFNKLARFLRKIGDENSEFYKILIGTKKGVEMARQVARTYNQFAPWLGLPLVPKFHLGEKKKNN